MMYLSRTFLVTGVSALKRHVAVACLVSVCLFAGNSFATPITIELTSDALGLGSVDINYAGNAAAVEANIPGKLVTSMAANVGSILTIEKTGLAGPGDLTNPLLVTVTARTYMNVLGGVPDGNDFQAGVITLTNDGDNVPKEGLGVRAFGIDLDTGSANYAKRYVNASYTATNGHGFQMEGSKDVSGGFPLVVDGVGSQTITWAQFIGENPVVPNNSPPHVNEDVTFDFNDSLVAVEANSLVFLLTNIKAGSGPFDLAIDLTINLVGGGSVVRSYGFASDAPDVFSVPDGYDEGDKILQMDLGAPSLGLTSADIVDSVIIGARDDDADGNKETDEHFLINGFFAEYTDVPEPTSIGLLVLGGLAVLRRRRKA